MIDELIAIDVRVIDYTPVPTGSYIPTPKGLDNAKKGLLNIKNLKDHLCFKWSVLAHLYPAKSTNRTRLSHYNRIEHNLDFTGIDFPITTAGIARFERQNNIGINIFRTTANATIFPVRISDLGESRTDTIRLLQISNEVTSHFILITDLSKLIGKQYSAHDGHLFICDRCLHACYTRGVYTKHVERCSKLRAQAVAVPTVDKVKDITFTKREFQLDLPFSIYADFESVLEEVPADTIDPTAKTVPTQRHIACGAGYKIVSTDPRFYREPVILTGPNCAEVFLDRLQADTNELRKILSNPIPMIPLTGEQQRRYDEATTCMICEETLDAADRVRDHDHLTGAFRGAAHSNCNLQWRINPKTICIPVFMHNLKG